MSLQKAKPANTIYQVIPPRSKRTTDATDAQTVAAAIAGATVSVSVPLGLLESIYDRLKGAEQPRVAFNEDQGAMFLEAYRERGAVIKEVLQDLETYV